MKKLSYYISTCILSVALLLPGIQADAQTSGQAAKGNAPAATESACPAATTPFFPEACQEIS